MILVLTLLVLALLVLTLLVLTLLVLALLVLTLLVLARSHSVENLNAPDVLTPQTTSHVTYFRPDT